MDFYPAIDLLDGQCVRLVEGDFSRVTEYSSDPVEVARGFASAGARWLHVVDLDAARSGEPVNRSVVCAVAAAVAPYVRVQVGGGVRRWEDAEQLFAAGVTRVVIGTAAVQDGVVAQMARRWPGRVAVSVDHRAGEVQVRGWTASAEVSVRSSVMDAASAGASAVVVTNVARDGRMEGPDFDGLRALLAAVPGVPFIASGGVRSLDDVRAVAALGPGLAGVIAGRAIYEGALDVAEAVRACAVEGR